MTAEELKNRTKQFAHRCVKLSLALPTTKLGLHIQGQLIRCATSVAANYRATCLAQSSKSFVAKISIVIEEIDESAFWLEFIVEEELINKEKVLGLLNEAKELTAIFIASRKTAQKNNRQ
ncbi:MAG: four helix bundle protein [Ignavibacteria bacterium GWB2_35_6b]|nr:MAG: four helix bundle protein [Ignavibacteria bacterium GWB2_35_6b]